MPTSGDLKQSPLGQKTAYPQEYNPQLLFSIERKSLREALGITGSNPFFGLDFINAYELSWLNMRGKPQVGILALNVSSDSPNIVESKSLKLYLNSFAQKRFDDVGNVVNTLRADLSDAYGSPVQIGLRQASDFPALKMQELEGLSLDRLDISADTYKRNTNFLTSNQAELPVEETLVSNLLRTVCPVTGQPDWASLQIHYAGPQINQEGLLKYIISLRSQEAFHEQIIEQIFIDILQNCRPQNLTVYGRFTRRGGIDINPLRSNFTSGKRPHLARTARQ